MYRPKTKDSKNIRSLEKKFEWILAGMAVRTALFLM